MKRLNLTTLLLLAASSLASLAEASLTRVAPPAIERPALTVSSSALEPSEFSLFEGNELAPAAAESERAESFHPLAAVSLFSKDGAEGPLVSADELSYPKTRIRGLTLFSQKVYLVERELSLELRWGCADFSCGIASGTVGWLSQDPLGDQDSVNLYGFVGMRPHEKTDPLGLQMEGIRPGEDADYAFQIAADTRAREERGVNAGKRAAGAIAQGLDLLTDFAPGIGVAKIPPFFIEAYKRGGRSELSRLGLQAGAIAIIAAVITHGRRLPGVKVTEEELALERKAEAALEFEQRQLGRQASAASASVASKSGIPVGSTRHIKLPPAKKGSYTVTFESDIGYVGKGPPSRARRSARGHSREHVDPVLSIDHTMAETEEEALRQEAARLEALGGPKSPRNYNKINSPGKKLGPDDPP